MMDKPIANTMINRQTKWQWSQKHSLGSNHDEWNQHQWTNTVEIYTQGILARYDWIQEPMDPQMEKIYTLWILARSYLKTINQTLQKLKYLDNETKVELKQVSTILMILLMKQIIIKTHNQLWQEIKCSFRSNKQ